MYDKDAEVRAGFHSPTTTAEFQVFRSSDFPELGLPEGWYWDFPKYRAYTPTTRRIKAVYLYANGPFNTSVEAYDHAMSENYYKRRSSAMQNHRAPEGDL
jgi:hypothetical protein